MTDTVRRRNSGREHQQMSPGIKSLISNFRITVALLASFMIPLFVESMAEPEKFFMSANLITDDTEDK